jgi:hypothetical protein
VVCSVPEFRPVAGIIIIQAQLHKDYPWGEVVENQEFPEEIYDKLYHIILEIKMCRNIRPLYNYEPPATEDEIHLAALQFVRKISGFSRPSKVNEAAFQTAVEAIAAASSRLLNSLETSAAPRDRVEEAAKRQARSAQRFSR